MLSFDRTDQGWAVISQGSAEMAKAKGNTILKSLTQFEQWKQQAEQEGFVAAPNANLHDVHTPHHCSRLILPGATGTIPKRVVCGECFRPMEKFITYRCCTDEAGVFFGRNMFTVVDGMADKIEYMSDLAEVLTDKKIEAVAATAPVISEVAVAVADSVCPVAAL
ncbi:hypothetical protein RHSIM_Rhsim05G0212400 [Rhododendron simsii]|uniref:Sieve element occlusion C-terminal domain-containing protein n=1 Tax=Rhododendron simsii TaxID=118357 RepID=A0A834GUB8_RHOSS|nr:hypothetical protein RHSIM_Rhsim05G0212400 [Rhododendron simsii]